MQFAAIFKGCKMMILRWQKWYFSYFCLNINCRYKLEPPQLDGSNEYPQIYVSEQK